MGGVVYSRLKTKKQLVSIIQETNDSGRFMACDLETTGLDRFSDKILDVVISTKEGAVVFPPQWVQELNRLKTGLIFHNHAFDGAFLYEAGFDIRKLGIPIRDTMILYHLINEEGPFGLSHLVQEFYRDDYKDVFWAQNKTYEDAPESEQLEYACKDAHYTYRLYEDILLRIKEEGLENLIDHSHRLARALYDTTIEGIPVDLRYVTELGTRLKEEMTDTDATMRETVKTEIANIELAMWLVEMEKRKTDKGKAGVKRPEFNFASTKQLGSLLYGSLGIKAQKTKKGNPKVDDETLTKLKNRHPIVPLITTYRKSQKVFTAFIEGTLEKQHEGRIYPGFKVHGTKTGRISSNSPNLQQLPREGGIRGMYIAGQGNVLLSTDYSSLEVVIAAHFSQDKELLRIIKEGVSKHDITNESLKLSDRNKAKTLNFAAQYLCGPKKMAKILGAPLSEAEGIYKRYWETYAGERRVIDECIEKVNKGIPIVNLHGRKRRLKVEPYMQEFEKERLYRQGYNSLIQGTGADIMHEATYLIYDYFKETDYGRIWFEVHDEALVECKSIYAEKVQSMVEKIMVGVGERVGLTVPLSIETSPPLKRWDK